MEPKNTKETVQDQLDALYDQIGELSDKVDDLSSNTEEKDLSPYSKADGYNPIQISDIRVTRDGYVVWNDSELKCPPFGQKPPDPTIGYLRHFHTRYSGGALDVKATEMVQYNINWDTDDTHSKHSQQLWKDDPPISKTQNSKNENVDMIGTLDMMFDADNKIWGAVPHFIDVEKAYLVRINPLTKAIMHDENDVEMKSPLFNALDDSKSCVVWDTNAKVWRFIAVYTQDPH